MEHYQGSSGVAGFDQRQAEALERLRTNKRGFILFTLGDSESSQVLRMQYIGSVDDTTSILFMAMIVETLHMAMKEAGAFETDEDDDGES
jgi:hypothetical protein